MPITDAARRNRAKLFSDLVSPLADTDPELIELFDNWAFDDVLAESGPDSKTRLMLQLAAIIACQAVNVYRVMLGAALEVGVTPIEVKEIVYQAVPYVGMARVFDFLGVTNAVLQERGIPLPLEGQSTTTRDTRFDKGVVAQKRIFGGEHVEKMHADAPKDQRHIQAFLSANCFGDYYTRNSLDLKTRELLTFVLLTAFGGCDPQVAAHARGNLAVGNDRNVLLGAVTQLLPYIGYPRALNAIRAINEATRDHAS
ncbi:carboxymuconolactone decarboxylase family protein [Rhodanobacter sp. Col0626]|uniref:carboxymuconolactone decarboxylase family protein n=1 Tax=Rhodanobacter sp. Col0626 TaxID=3415679 RepID=UPI003CE87DFA